MSALVSKQCFLQNPVSDCPLYPAVRVGVKTVFFAKSRVPVGDKTVFFAESRVPVGDKTVIFAESRVPFGDK